MQTTARPPRSRQGWSDGGRLRRLLAGGRCTTLGGSLLAALLLAGAPARLGAHDSPEHVIEGLTARLRAEPKRPDLLWRRALEHRALGHLAEASRDLQRALKLQNDFLPALTELSRVRLAQGKRRQAEDTVNRALALVPDEAGRAPLRMVRAEIRSEAGDWRGALSDCDRAMTNASGGELDWYLTRSQIQCRLGLFREAVAGLNEGFARTGSAVLEVEGIDAMLDGGFFAEAAGKIQPLLEECRWQSAWLIRRARARIGLGEVTAGQNDLIAALRELAQRGNGIHPDPGLVAERALAYALLGDAVLSRRQLETARKLGAEAAALRRVESALAAR